MRAKANTIRSCFLLASVLAFAGGSFAQSKAPVAESRPVETSRAASAGNYHFHVHLGSYCCTSDGAPSDARNTGDITAPYGVVTANGDATWQPSRYMRFSKAVAIGEQEQALAAVPAPLLGDVAREQRGSKADEKADVVIKQDAKGQPVVVRKQP